MRLALVGLTAIIVLQTPAALAQIFPGPGGATELPTPAPLDEEADPVIAETVRSTLTTTTTVISARISDILLRPVIDPAGVEPAALGHARQLGRNQGAGFGQLAAWTSGSVTFLENDGAVTPFDGEIYAPLFGADTALPNGWVFGLALGYEGSRFDTDFNAGSLDADGVSVTPYVGTRIGDVLLLDAGLGYARLAYEQTGTIGSARFTGEFDGDRFIAFANATALAPERWHAVKGLTLSGRVGLRYSREEQSGFTTGAAVFDGGVVELGQATFGAEARYAHAPGSGIEQIEAFLRAEGVVDFVQSDLALPTELVSADDDRTEARLGVGAVLRVTRDLSLDLSYTRSFARADIDEQTVTAGFRWRF